MRLATASQESVPGGGDGGNTWLSVPGGGAGGAGDGIAGGMFGQVVLDGAVHLLRFVTHGLNSPGLRGSLV